MEVKSDLVAPGYRSNTDNQAKGMTSSLSKSGLPELENDR